MNSVNYGLKTNQNAVIFLQNFNSKLLINYLLILLITDFTFYVNNKLTNENSMYENWQQCQSRDSAIWLVGGNLCRRVSVLFQQQEKLHVNSSISLVGNTDNS